MKPRFRPVADILEDRSLMSSFGGGNIDYSIPRYPSTAPQYNLTSNSFHQINATIPAVAASIVQTPSGAESQLATYVAHIPNGETSLLPILETDLTLYQKGGSTVTTTAATSVVDTIYMDTLARSPSTAELNAGIAALQDGATVAQVLYTVVSSPEFIQDNTTTGATTTANDTQFVTALYSDVLGRTPDTPGLDSWVSQLDAGTLTYQQVASDFVFSSEASTSPTSEVNVGARLSVDAVYQALLNRAPGTAELDAGINALTTGYGTVADITLILAQSPEFQQDNTTTGATTTANDTQFVTALYSDVLGRTPDTPGLDSWVSQLDAGTLTYQQVAADFVDSSEATTSSTSILQTAAYSFGGTAYYYGTVVPGGTITGNFAGTTPTVQVENLIQQDTLAYLANGIGKSFNILKSNVGWASDNLLTFNGHV